MTGTLRAQFDQFGKIEILDLLPTEHNELVPRALLAQLAQGSPDTKQSPNVTKGTNKKGAQQRQKQIQAREQPPRIPVPDSMVDDWGTTRAVSQILEVRTFTTLNPA